MIDSMSYSLDAMTLVKHFDALRLHAYRDSGGVLTIGYGHTGDVRQGEVITLGTALALLGSDLSRAACAVRRTPIAHQLNQHQFDALVSFCYNCGPLNLNKLVRLGLVETPSRFALFVHDHAGHTLPGLVTRRRAERELFEEGVILKLPRRSMH